MLSIRACVWQPDISMRCMPPGSVYRSWQCTSAGSSVKKWYSCAAESIIAASLKGIYFLHAEAVLHILCVRIG